MKDTLPTVEDFATLYRFAFAEYGTLALWNMRPVAEPTPADVLAITKALRTHSGMEGRRLAERIEGLCGALTRLQSHVLRVLASERSPDSYGGVGSQSTATVPVFPATLIFFRIPSFDSKPLIKPMRRC